MSKHTPEPWSYGFPKANGVDVREAKCMVSAGGWHVASVSHGHIYPAEPLGSQTREANARRIVACVNACVGVSNGELAMTTMSVVLARMNEAEHKRDELLVAVEKVFVELERLDASGDVGGWIFDEVELLRAAIAKAKGGAA